jgi:ComEC/Rec2-related protein
MIRPPVTIAALAGWIGAAFLGGVLVHSLRPYQSFYSLWFLAIFIVALNFLVMGWKHVWLRTAGLCAIALLMGVWRFDMARPTIPKNLKPFSAKHLAFEKNDLILGDQADPRHWLGRGRLFLTERSSQLFAPAEAALLSGILYGERALPKETKDQFRRAGLLHIIAVSGSNITILAVLVMRSLLLFRLERRKAFLLFSFVLLAYVFFVNPSPSVVRAALMGWLVELAFLVGRIPRASRLLLLAAVFFSWWKPWSLIYDASFALSFLAMWGLLTFGTSLNGWLEQKAMGQGLREIISATVGATLMTVPYTAWAFGQVSVWGLLTSLLALPLIPWVMGLGLAALLVPVPYLFTLPTSGFLKMLLFIGRMPDYLPFGYWSNLSTSFAWMIGMYGCLYLIWRHIEGKNRVIHATDALYSNDPLTS